jgi:hypothetical protein
MQRNYCIDIDYQLKLIKCKHMGNICMKEISDARIELFQIGISIPGRNNYLIDCRDVALDFDFEVDFDFKAGYSTKLWDFMEANKGALEGRMEAILVDKPLVCAYSMLFKEECDKRNYGYKVCLFSTEEAALWWLEVHSVTNDNR